MELISRFVLYIDNAFYLSHFSKGIIIWSLTALSIYGIFTFFYKAWDETRMATYVGFMVRLVLLIGLSIEMLHQVNITEISALYYERQPSLRQFLHFLFFGYIIVVGFYYIVTLKQNKTEGLFFTFDIAVLTLPSFQLITSLVMYLLNGELSQSEMLGLLIILIIIIASLYLFFFNYWEVRMRTLIPFYFIVISVSLLAFLVGFRIMELSNLFVFLTLLMTYHLIKNSKCSWLEKVKRPFSFTVAILFLILCNPLYNVADFALASTNAEVRLRYFDSTKLIQLKEAREIAQNITGDEHFLFQQPETEDFHNRYLFRSKNYSVEIDGISGAVFSLQRQTESVGKKLSPEEYVNKSKQLLGKLGRTLLSDEQILTSISEENGFVHIEMAPKLTSGAQMPGVLMTTFTWEKESLVAFYERFNLYPVENLKGIEINTKEINSILKEWYTMLEQEMPDYVIEDVQYGYSNRTIEIYLLTAKGHSIHLDGHTGEVLYFAGNLENDEEVDFEEMETKILASKNIHFKNWKRERVSIFWEWRENDPDDMKLSYVHQFAHTIGDPLFIYDKGIDYYHKVERHVKIDSSKEAYAIIAKEIDYTPYASRAKLTEVIDENDQIRLAWLIVIQPYKQSEHRLYLVDIETKEWVSLYE